jgi:hypothetical protein
MNKITIPLTTLSGPAEIEGFRVGQTCWAIAKKLHYDGWGLTHIPSGAVDSRGDWDEATARALAERLTEELPSPLCVPEDVNTEALPRSALILPWANAVLAEGNRIALAIAGPRLAPKMEGLRLFRVNVERRYEVSLYVLAETATQAEELSRSADIDDWGEEEDSEFGYEIEADSIPEEDLGHLILAPKGFPPTNVREVLAALSKDP